MARLPSAAVRRRWERLIALYKDSDSTVAEFCEQHGVSPASLYQWRRKLAAADETDQFLAVEVVGQAVARRATTVRFTCGTELELHSEDHASLLLVVDRLSSIAPRSQP